MKNIYHIIFINTICLADDKIIKFRWQKSHKSIRESHPVIWLLSKAVYRAVPLFYLLLQNFIVNSIHEELANITSRFDKFLEKYARVVSDLEISKNCTKLLSRQIETLQRHTLDPSQYLGREMREMNLVPDDIQGTQLEESLCKVLSLPGTIVWPSVL